MKKKLTSLCYFVLLLSSSTQAVLLDNDSGYESAIVRIEGVVYASTCTLDHIKTTSNIKFSDLNSNAFRRAGDFGPKKVVSIALDDCLLGSSEYTSENGSQDIKGRVYVNVGFSGVTDHENNELGKLNGVKGLGIRLFDSQGKKIPINTPGKIQKEITIGHNEFIYYVALESTGGGVEAGKFSGYYSFYLEYL